MRGKEKVSPNEGAEQSPEESPPVVTRTRSGRKVRAPAARLGSQVAAPAKTPTRRTRKSALPEEHPEVNADAAVPPEEAAWAVRGGGSENERTAPCPEPVDTGDADCVMRGVDGSASPTPRETAPTLPSKKTPKNPTSGSKPPPLIPLGKPKSGRIWKDRNKQRFSALLRDKPLCSSWEKKMEAKREKELVKSYSLELKGQKAKEKEDKRKRREENLKRRAENERKAEIVQVIRNTAKIKRMKKKHLRKIEKRDTLAMLQKSQPKTESQRARQ